MQGEDKINQTISKVLLTVDQFKGSISSFRSAVVENEYLPSKSKHFSRVLLWKTLCILNTLNIHTWSKGLQDSRQVFEELYKRKDLNIPWWKLRSDNIYYLTKEISRRESYRKTHRQGVRNGTNKVVLTRVNISETKDPLASSNNVDDHEGTKNVELLETIIMDIERLFPGEKFYAFENPYSKQYKRDLIEILYIWSKCNSNIGYKQGFHEIMGLIYMNLAKESVEVPSNSELNKEDLSILNIYDKEYLKHDIFAIFNKFMVQSHVVSSFYDKEQKLMECIETFNVNLMKVDQIIHYNLISKVKLESQLWIIRYFRLLLLRELGNDLETVSLFWDKLVAVQAADVNTPLLISFGIIVLLIKMKGDLIRCDFSESLGMLLHPPINTLLKDSTPEKFVQELFANIMKLYSRKDDDFKLYEIGLKINNKWNNNLRIVMSPQKQERPPSGARDSTETLNAPEKGLSNTDKMAFEKFKFEQRLKKRVQEITSKSK